jgi:hypothetical protein
MPNVARRLLVPLHWFSEPQFETIAVGTAHFEPASVSFRQDGRQAMAKKVLDSRWQPKLLWTARRLAELSAEVDTLRKKVRIAEVAASNSLARAHKVRSGHMEKQLRP